jgi:predicted transcriptional regulator of viral defense system
VDVRTLSRTEARVVLELESAERDTIAIDELQRIGGLSRGFARKVASTLVRKGWLQRARRGLYLFNPSRLGPDAVPDNDPLRIGSLLASPYYFGFGTAAELHGLLPQAGREYYIVTTSRTGPSRRGNARFRPIQVPPRKFFGIDSIRRRGREIAVSDIERTLLDCLARPEFAGGMGGVVHAMSVAKPKINWPRAEEYLGRLANSSLTRRFGFLAERVRPSVRPPARWTRALLPSGGAPYVPLAPPRNHGRRGTRDSRWKVIQNASDEELFSEGRIP